MNKPQFSRRNFVKTTVYGEMAGVGTLSLPKTPSASRFSRLTVKPAALGY